MHPTSLPTILIVTGAWFPIQSYQKFGKSLRAAGYDVVYASLPSHNPTEDPESHTCATDTAFVRDHLLAPLIERDGKNVVVLMHSYGGMPGAGAATTLSRSRRQIQGKQGGVVGLIMVSGFVVGENMSLVSCLGGDLPPWVMKDTPKQGCCFPTDAKAMFEADVPESEAALDLKLLRPHATSAFFSPQPAPAFASPDFKGLLGFIRPLKDDALPPAGMDMMMQYSGAEWSTRDINTSHNGAFLTHVDETIEHVNDLVQEFARRRF